MNGSTPSPAGINDITAGVSTGVDVWSPSTHSNFVGTTAEVRRSESMGDIGTFIADGIYHESDLALSTHNSFSGLIASPTAVMTNSENGTALHQPATVTASSSMLISPTASTISETASSATPPGNNGRPVQQKANGGGKSAKSSGAGGGGAFCAFEERQCKQRCINGFRHCIRHILCDPTAPYRPCSYVKKQGAKETRCSNAVALSQGSEYVVFYGSGSGDNGRSVWAGNTSVCPFQVLQYSSDYDGHERSETAESFHVYWIGCNCRN